MEQTNAQRGRQPSPESIGQLRARKKTMKTELAGLIRQAATLEDASPATGAPDDLLASIVDREKELCRELADVISSIRTHNSRSRQSRKLPEMAVPVIAAVDTAIHYDPFFDAPVDITSCVTNCDSDCVTNCTDGCTLACDSDCRTGCTSGCTFSQSGSNTGSYIVTPTITADGQTELQPVTSNQFSIEWN